MFERIIAPYTFGNGSQRHAHRSALHLSEGVYSRVRKFADIPGS